MGCLRQGNYFQLVLLTIRRSFHHSIKLEINLLTVFMTAERNDCSDNDNNQDSYHSDNDNNNCIVFGIDFVIC